MTQPAERRPANPTRLGRNETRRDGRIACLIERKAKGGRRQAMPAGDIRIPHAIPFRQPAMLERERRIYVRPQPDWSGLSPSTLIRLLIGYQLAGRPPRNRWRFLLRPLRSAFCRTRLGRGVAVRDIRPAAAVGQDIQSQPSRTRPGPTRFAAAAAVAGPDRPLRCPPPAALRRRLVAAGRPVLSVSVVCWNVVPAPPRCLRACLRAWSVLENTAHPLTTLTTLAHALPLVVRLSFLFPVRPTDRPSHHCCCYWFSSIYMNEPPHATRTTLFNCCLRRRLPPFRPVPLLVSVPR